MRLEGVGRRYRARGPWVLWDVDLDVPQRTLMRVEGVNGTGKSTLLRLLAGIDAPTKGRVTGRPRTAYVPERFPAAMPFGAAGYLTHLGRVHGLPGRLAEQRAAEWLERFGIAGYAGTPMERLSKGTAQKVAVAGCVQEFLLQPDRGVIYTELKNNSSSYQRRQLIQKNKWAADRDVAGLCDQHIQSLDPLRLTPPEPVEEAAEARQPA